MSIFCSKIKYVSAYYENVDFVFFSDPIVTLEAISDLHVCNGSNQLTYRSRFYYKFQGREGIMEFKLYATYKHTGEQL